MMKFDRNPGISRRSSSDTHPVSAFGAGDDGAVAKLGNTPRLSLSRLIDSLCCSFHCRPVGNWLYREADGTEVMRVLRFDPPDAPKQYRPIHFDGTWWRVGDPPDRLLPLYRLPELVKKESVAQTGVAKTGSRPILSGPSDLDRTGRDPFLAASDPLLSVPMVFVTEGEKCADAACSIGLCGTTSAHGAASAERTDWSPLAGRNVVILPDNDPAGVQYAQNVARLILQQSPQPTVQIVTLPDLAPKGDLADWLDHRDSAEPEALRKQIEALVDATKPLDPAELIGGPELVSLSSIQGRDVRWLWPSRIARGKITLLAGDPGVGKSFLTLDLAARVSTGAEFPDGAQSQGSAGVILISAEDDLHDTVHPRLMKMGAEMSRITWLQSVKQILPEGRTHSRAFTLEDVAALRDALRRTSGVWLVVIDPVSAYLGDKCDGNNNAQVRGMLAQLNLLASEFDCAMVLVTHLNKSKESNARSRAIYRAMGSLAFVAAARCAMLACKDPKDPDRKLLLPMKNNIGNDTDGLAWKIENGAVVWESEPVQVSSDEAMTSDSASSEPTALVTVTDWLRQRLSGGSVPAVQIKQEAMRAGFSTATLERARVALGVRARKSSGGEFNSSWVWALPEAAPPMLIGSE